jgi:carbonic anhydrase
MSMFSRSAHLSALFGVVAAFTLASCSSTETASTDDHGDEAHAIHWGYETANGPNHWGEMDAEWILCAEGLGQSPIDLTDAVVQSVEPVDIDVPSQTEVTVLNQREVFGALDNGHTIQINAPTGEILAVGDQSYALVQFHFHAPSEHTVNGEHFPMEMHFVHQSEDGKLAVVGVLIEEGAENVGIEPIWEQLSEEHGTQTKLQLPEGMADKLFPTAKGIYYYDGSLTTPPCSEGVSWFVMKSPTQFAKEQIDAFTAVYDHNNRPVQPLNERQLFVDDDPAVTIH